MLLSCSFWPDPVQPGAAAPDYWLVLDPMQDARRSWPIWAARTVAVPVVQSLGVDISRVRPVGHGRIHLGPEGGSHAEIAIVSDVDRYVFDAAAGFEGFEPYQRAFLMITSGTERRGRHWQVTLRAVPRFGDPEE